MLTGQFREAMSSKPVSLQGISTEIFEVIKEYLYTNQMPSLTFDMADEVFVAADMLLLPGLRTEATNWIILNHMITLDNVFDALRLAQHFSMTKLEEQCEEVIAMNLEACAAESDFLDFVAESIQSIQNRQETDSVPLIDDLRYQIVKIYGKHAADDNPDSARSVSARTRKEKLALLDQVITTLGVKRTPYRE